MVTEHFVIGDINRAATARHAGHITCRASNEF